MCADSIAQNTQNFSCGGQTDFSPKYLHVFGAFIGPQFVFEMMGYLEILLSGVPDRELQKVPAWPIPEASLL